MNKYQSLISAVISAFCIFALPVLNSKGIFIDENTVTTIVITIIGIVAFLWTAWKNHNITNAAHEAQAIMDELKCDNRYHNEEPKDGDSDVLLP